MAPPMANRPDAQSVSWLVGPPHGWRMRDNFLSDKTSKHAEKLMFSRLGK